MFEVYYFRMYMMLVAVGAFHSLLLLPVMLALVGPRQEEPATSTRLTREEASEESPPKVCQPLLRNSHAVGAVFYVQ
jgi:hypothetical protein